MSQLCRSRGSGCRGLVTNVWCGCTHGAVGLGVEMGAIGTRTSTVTDGEMLPGPSAVTQ